MRRLLLVKPTSADSTAVEAAHGVLGKRAHSPQKQAVCAEVVARNVAKLVEVETLTYEVGRGLTVPTAKSLLEAVKGERLESLYVGAVYLGLRGAEVLGPRWEDIDFEQQR